MPRAESTSVTLRRDLSQAATEYDVQAAQMGMIGLRVLPYFPVGEPTASFPVLNRESFKKTDDVARAESGNYNRILGEFGSGTYTTEEHGLEYVIDDRRRRRYASFLDAETYATRLLRHRILMAFERRVATLTLNNSTTWAGVAATTVWSTSATAVPLTDLITGMETLEDNTGIPRTMLSLIIPRTDLKEFLATTQVTNKMQYTYPGVIPAMLSNQQVANLLGINQVLVPTIAYDATEEGYAESNTQVWTAGRAMLAYLAQGAGTPLETPQLGRTMIWTAEQGLDGPTVETYREDKIRADVVRVRDDTDEVLIGGSLCGYVVTT